MRNLADAACLEDHAFNDLDLQYLIFADMEEDGGEIKLADSREPIANVSEDTGDDFEVGIQQTREVRSSRVRECREWRRSSKIRNSLNWIQQTRKLSCDALNLDIDRQRNRKKSRQNHFHKGQ